MQNLATGYGNYGCCWFICEIDCKVQSTKLASLDNT